MIFRGFTITPIFVNPLRNNMQYTRAMQMYKRGRRIQVEVNNKSIAVRYTIQIAYRERQINEVWSNRRPEVNQYKK